MITKAQRTAAELAVYKQAGVLRRRGRLPRQQWPQVIERTYRAALLRYVDLTLAACGDLIRALPGLLAEAQAERRVDADPRERVRAEVKKAKERLQESLKQHEIDALAREFAKRTETHQRVQLQRQTKAALGADIFTADRRIPGLVNGFVVENAQLITSIPEKLMLEIADATARAVANATPHPKLAKELSNRFGITRDRATLIARDQVGKLYGQINAARQQELGVTEFVWRTVKDERVRSEHEEREGQVYRYDDPPEGELPGEPINCRCFAEPVFANILDELDAFAAKAPSSTRTRRR